MDRTTLTAALKPLERRGLVRSEANPKDKRSRLLVLTDKGLALLAEAVPIWRREHGMLDEDLGAERLGTLHSGLSAVAAGPDKQREPA